MGRISGLGVPVWVSSTSQAMTKMDPFVHLALEHKGLEKGPERQSGGSPSTRGAVGHASPPEGLWPTSTLLISFDKNLFPGSSAWETHKEGSSERCGCRAKLTDFKATTDGDLTGMQLEG